MRSWWWISTLFFRVESEKLRREYSESIKYPWRECAIQSLQDKVQDLPEWGVGCVQCLCLSVYMMEMPGGHDTSQTSSHGWSSVVFVRTQRTIVRVANGDAVGLWCGIRILLSKLYAFVSEVKTRHR